MAFDIQRLIDRIGIFEPKIVVRLSVEFASSNPSHRTLIRQSIHDSLDHLNGAAKERVLDTAFLPETDKWSISISHCRTIGGWVALPKPRQIGFDLELKSRIHARLSERIAQPGELNDIPDPALLWSAKESYFKALGSRQPSAITELRIENWRTTNPNFYEFSARGMRGLVISDVDLFAGVTIL